MHPSSEGGGDEDSKSGISFYSNAKSEECPVADLLEEKLKKNGFEIHGVHTHSGGVGDAITTTTKRVSGY